MLFLRLYVIRVALCVMHWVANGAGHEHTASEQLAVPSGFPAIITHPRLKAVESGRSALLTCDVTGNPEPTVRWLKDGFPVDLLDERIHVYSSGALEIETTQESDEGNYGCVAENYLGSVHSYEATLYVRVRPVPPHFTHIVPQDRSVRVSPGDSFTLVCEASGSPTPSVQWLKASEPLSDPTPGHSEFLLFDIRESATYTCSAYSSSGEITHEVVVDVASPVTIVVAPRNQTMLDDNLADFYCEASDNSSIYWLIDGNPIRNRRRGAIRYTEASRSVLRIEPVLRNLHNIAQVTCVVGDDVSASAALTVLSRNQVPPGFPEITTHPSLKAVEAGRSTLMVCDVTGNPQPTVTWLKDGFPVDLSDERIDVYSSGALEIQGAKGSDEGRYECVAENTWGSKHSYSANLYVRVRRVPPHARGTPFGINLTQ